jgi:hypothetical protein
VAQLYPQAPSTHFSRLLRHAWATVGLFFSPVTTRGNPILQARLNKRKSSSNLDMSVCLSVCQQETAPKLLWCRRWALPMALEPPLLFLQSLVRQFIRWQRHETSSDETRHDGSTLNFVEAYWFWFSTIHLKDLHKLLCRPNSFGSFDMLSSHHHLHIRV